MPPALATRRRRRCGLDFRRRFMFARLFDRFTRGTTSPGEGAGLGLSIAQSYARAHGGSLTYQPAEPHGARFRLILPAG